ncbi:E3 ubiquitin-protein ligase rglg2-like [Plakobranchus ocellatus]|uniref:E3 ubiquitin-protein ligase rglg2-like n=1 Tax=Plakobranchus ocellatus TaxID=259542 RepID=A0AAV3ZLG9_9GAST|nr:E3 ubiquitin-protein ligase rglg2-like [Plakobranchus ocellatus]
MSGASDSGLFDDINEEKPMTFWSCLLYVIANITGLLLYWFYQRQSAQRLRQEELGRSDSTNFTNGTGSDYNINCGSSSNSPTGSGGGYNYNFYINYNYQQRQHKRSLSQSSLLSILGLSYNGYKTFYSFEDRFCNFEDVARACRKAGLETCGLIVGVDFSASNEWQGRKTFSGQNLHKVVPGKILNPYQKVISIIGRTLESFDEDNLIPAFGFGDTLTTSKAVFSFKMEENGKGGEEEGHFETGDTCAEEQPCRGFTEVLEKYGDIASKITLGGPTNFAPIINKAVSIVRRLKRYHILIVIADGQVTEHSSTVQAIVDASFYPLSIVMVGVGDGPWSTMEQFDNLLPERCFDNFQFVNFHAVTDRCRKSPEASFALHAMMEIPDQYKTIKTLGYLEESPSSEHHPYNVIPSDSTMSHSGNDGTGTNNSSIVLSPARARPQNATSSKRP